MSRHRAGLFVFGGPCLGGGRPLPPLESCIDPPGGPPAPGSNARPSDYSSISLRRAWTTPILKSPCGPRGPAKIRARRWEFGVSSSGNSVAATCTSQSVARLGGRKSVLAGSKAGSKRFSGSKGSALELVRIRYFNLSGSTAGQIKVPQIKVHANSETLVSDLRNSVERNTASKLPWLTC